MKFKMMKVFNVVSFYGIVISWLNHCANAIPYREAKLIITNDDEPTTVHLKQSKSFLANENLPIWMVRDGELFKTDSEEVMEQLGPFTMYQDPDSSSAAVYFHKRRAFDGTIDARYIIKGLIPDNDDDDNDDEDQESNYFQSKFPIFERNRWGHANTTDVTQAKRQIPTYVSEWIKEQPPALCEEHQSQIFYVETLVVINHKLAVELLYEYSDSSAVISYMLTLFNSVDMLLTKLDPPNIKINIAGIIIENELDSIPNMASCYKQTEYEGILIDYLGTSCAVDTLYSFLPRQRDEVHLDSYDVFMYLARYPLYGYNYDEKTESIEMDYVTGITLGPSGGSYKLRKKNNGFRAGVLISDIRFAGSFAAIAHEMVHAFGIPEHDGEIGIKSGVCSAKLMKEYDGHCSQCLNWSDSTKKLVQSIFSSPDRCLFINEPRSLYPPGSRRMLTANEQCQCYGYVSAQNTQEMQPPPMFCWNMFSTSSDYCDDHLRCVGEDSKVDGTLIPMDGTPCEEHDSPNKVCWNRVCEEITGELY